MHQYVLVCNNMYLYVLIKSKYVLVHTSMYLYVIGCTGMHWHKPVFHLMLVPQVNLIDIAATPAVRRCCVSAAQRETGILALAVQVRDRRSCVSSQK